MLQDQTKPTRRLHTERRRRRWSHASLTRPPACFLSTNNKRANHRPRRRRRRCLNLQGPEPQGTACIYHRGTHLHTPDDPGEDLEGNVAANNTAELKWHRSTMLMNKHRFWLRTVGGGRVQSNSKNLSVCVHMGRSCLMPVLGIIKMIEQEKTHQMNCNNHSNDR